MVIVKCLLKEITCQDNNHSNIINIANDNDDGNEGSNYDEEIL